MDQISIEFHTHKTVKGNILPWTKGMQTKTQSNF